MANSKTGGSDDIDANGKYLLISVPEFAEDPVTPGKLMTSYLRLGAASTSWRDDPGGELAANIALSGPPGAELSPAHAEVDIQGDEGEARPVFVDDTRGREDCPEPHLLSVAERKKQSQVLHTRGGWRDHSDGNRITTTHGDKIEVIRGNYKMVVLGRQDDPTAAAGWDASGQHIQDFASTKPGASVRVEWTQDHGGVWHLQNTTEGVVQSSNYAGDFYEYRWGKHHETTIGSDSPVERLPDPDGRPRGNPHIINKTWAEKIESYTGSPACRVPLVKEEKWADTAESTFQATSLSTSVTVEALSAHVTVEGLSVEAKIAGAIVETTTTGSLVSTTVAGSITELTEAGMLLDTTVVGVVSEITLAGNKTEVLIADSYLDMQLVKKRTEVFMGTNVEITAGVNIGIHMTKDLEISLEKAEVSQEHTSTASSVSHSANEYNVSAPMVRLGLG